MATRVAFITGITGQDGSYLAELLLEKNYVIYGIQRRTSLFQTSRIDRFRHRIHMFYGDLTDRAGLHAVLQTILEEQGEHMGRLEVYNLGAMSHVKVSFDVPEYTMNVDAIGALTLLELLRQLSPDVREKVRYYQAGTSEMYGDVATHNLSEDTGAITEDTPFDPVSPYACAKVAALFLTKTYRRAYGLFACNGILFNHESPRRGENFVTAKVVRAAKRLVSGDGTESPLELGNLYSRRDWGHAKDYVRAMHLMLQQDVPRDYLVATGTSVTVKEFVVRVFEKLGKKLEWRDEKTTSEHAVDNETGQTLVRVSKKYFRPTEVPFLKGDSQAIRRDLGWTPEYDLDALIDDMLHGHSV